ncbi:hypothetical protein JHD50_05060, partial [Sulfurimonas sp. MAG313]
ENLVKEKDRLNASALILVEKNHSLIEQITKLKRNQKKDIPNDVLVQSQKNEKALKTRNEVLHKELLESIKLIEKVN